MTPRVREPAPSFQCPAIVNGEMTSVSLADYRGKYLVLMFYPGDFTFVCPTELHAFSDRIEEFRAIGTEVIAASLDSQHCHLSWLGTPRSEGGVEGVNLPLLADVTRELSNSYGVLMEEEGVTLRGTFTIDPKGIMRHVLVNDLPIGRSVDEALRVIQALQFHAENGDVCPVNWTPGAATITPEPEASKSYFRQQG